LNNVEHSIVETSEPRLVELATAGDREARRELFERFRDVAYRVALRITGRHEDALDVVQDGFIRAFERLGDFQRESGFQTWLLRIVSNRALDLLRARKVRLVIPLQGDDDDPRGELAAPTRESRPGGALERAELAERLRQAIESLPPDQRAVFALYASGDLTYGQIAEVLGIPIGTVMSRLYHARRKLHEMLPDLAPESGNSENSENT
jgi:RNA polymerase sigma-70 factor, ECF subfamily